MDWHSFRRAFSTALADAGVNVQHAMHLAKHSDPKVHARYVMSSPAMRAIPAAALPAMSLVALPEEAKAPRKGGGIVTARDVSSTAATKSARNADNLRAGEGIRTLDVNLGKVALYH